MMNSTAIFLDSAGLFLIMIAMRVLSGVVFSVLLHGNLLRHSVLVLGGLGDSEGGASSFLLSTASSSDLSLDDILAKVFLYTFTSISLDSACVF